MSREIVGQTPTKTLPIVLDVNTLEITDEQFYNQQVGSKTTKRKKNNCHIIKGKQLNLNKINRFEMIKLLISIAQKKYIQIQVKQTD